MRSRYYRFPGKELAVARAGSTVEASVELKGRGLWLDWAESLEEGGRMARALGLGGPGAAFGRRLEVMFADTLADAFTGKRSADPPLIAADVDCLVYAGECAEEDRPAGCGPALSPCGGEGEGGRAAGEGPAPGCAVVLVVPIKRADGRL